MGGDLRFRIYDLRAVCRVARKSDIVNRKCVRLVLALAMFLISVTTSPAEPRFPPPDFSETQHQLPITWRRGWSIGSGRAGG